MEKDNLKDETANSTNTVLVAGTNEGLQIGFTCKICDGTQTLPPSYYRAETLFPICNECLKDLKEFIVSKRKGACH